MRNSFSTVIIIGSVFASACELDPVELDEVELAALTALDTTTNPHGQGSTLPSAGPIDTSPSNPFFASIGTNGRTCQSCHFEKAGWSITPAIAQGIAAATPSSPLFHPVDGTDCPQVALGNPQVNSTQLLQRGNIRIDMPIPAGADFVLHGFADPNGCAVRPSGARLTMFRRPLPTTNVAFLATVMWDGRESRSGLLRDDLKVQSNSATVGHAQATVALSDAQANQIVDFELPLFSAQTQLKVGSETINLTAGVSGGPIHLATTVAPSFFIGINDTFDPAFDREAFTLYAMWEPSAPQTGLTPLQKSVGRGERIFNTRTFSITNVGGLNGALDASQAPFTGTCTTCHNNPDVGNHSSPLPINIGLSEATSVSPAGQTLNISRLPIYTFRQLVTNKVITVTDPGRALITGRFKDIGKMKGPILRGLAAREPLFHNGSATIAQAVNFYNVRFNIGLTTQDKTDLGNFLKAL